MNYTGSPKAKLQAVLGHSAFFNDILTAGRFGSRLARFPKQRLPNQYDSRDRASDPSTRDENKSQQETNWAFVVIMSYF